MVKLHWLNKFRLVDENLPAGLSEEMSSSDMPLFLEVESGFSLLYKNMLVRSSSYCEASLVRCLTELGLCSQRRLVR